jgi:hypothetical protein
MTKLKGLEGMLEFLSFLRQHQIMYRIDQQVDDGIEVNFALVGYRFEVTFFVDHIEFSYFTGHEDVEMDEDLLFKIIKDNT